MALDRAYTPEDDTNPYIALSDLAINLVLILAFCVAAANVIGRAGWDKVKYRDAQAAFRAAVNAMPDHLRPDEHPGKHDPPGAQRWVFRGASLFRPGTPVLLPEGTRRLKVFARALATHNEGNPERSRWRRVRIEGHNRRTIKGEEENWELSAARAAAVARILYPPIPPHRMAVSARGGQDPGEERVEVVVEYHEVASGGRSTSQ